MTGHAHELIPGKLFANLHVTNDAGKKVTLVWSEDDSPKTQDIEDGKSVYISKSLDKSAETKPSYAFQVHEYGTDNTLLINGQSEFSVIPSEKQEAVQNIEITSGLSWKFFSFIAYNLP